MRNTEEGKIGWICTVALGNPAPDLAGAVSPAWVHLRRHCGNKCSLTSKAELRQRHDNGTGKSPFEHWRDRRFCKAWRASRSILTQGKEVTEP